MWQDDDDKTVQTAGTKKPLASESSEAYLIVIKGGDVGGKKYLLTPGKNIVGRMPKADITLDQESISRKHAEIVLDIKCKTAVVTDLNSTNGTFYKDRKIKNVEIEDGDQIEFGDITCKFVTDINAEGELLEFASIDEMTSAYNKRYFQEIMTSEFKKSLKAGTILSQIMIDIDKFKLINDTHGHSAGDYILKSLCRLVSSFVSEEMTFARIGGEEFAIILPGVNKAEAVEIAEKIRVEIENYTFKFGKEIIPVTASFGVCERTDDIKDMKSFLYRTDSLLYLAKNTGRNRVCS